MWLLQNSNPPVGRKVVTPGRRDNNDEVRCPCSRVVGERPGRVEAGAEGERQLRPELEEEGESRGRERERGGLYI